MTYYLLDTCIISKLRKISKYPDPKLQNWISKHHETQYYLSILTIGEIQKGISQLKDSNQKDILENWLIGEVIPRFEKRIYPIDVKVASKWGELSGQYAQKGISIPVIDGLIAATAIVHDLVLVTENEKDFKKIKELSIDSPTFIRHSGL